MAETPSSDKSEGVARSRTREWVERAVVGLDLCPFASQVLRDGRLRIAVESARGVDEAVELTLAEVEGLLASDVDEVQTTLVVFSSGLEEFEVFLEAAAGVRGALEAAGADEMLQVATFHPDYRFEGTEPEAVENYTNRSPYPILHLLRERDVTRAVEHHPDPESIPDDNRETLRDIGLERIREIWSSWMPSRAD